MTAHLRCRALVAGSLAVTAALALTACSADSDKSADKSAGKGKTHLVKTAMGDVPVPDAPKRVVVLDTAELDSTITLGVKPVGSTHVDASNGFLSYLPKDKLDGIKDVDEMQAHLTK